MYGFCQLAAPKFGNYKVVKVGVYGFIPEYTVLNSFYTDTNCSFITNWFACSARYIIIIGNFL